MEGLSRTGPVQYWCGATAVDTNPTQLQADEQGLTRGVYVQNDQESSDDAWICNSDGTTGLMLRIGDKEFFPIDDLNKLYFVSEGTSTINWTAE